MSNNNMEYEQGAPADEWVHPVKRRFLNRFLNPCLRPVAFASCYQGRCFANQQCSTAVSQWPCMQCTCTEYTVMESVPVFHYYISLQAKSIEWFIEGQDFSRLYELAPPPPPVRKLSTGDTKEDWEIERELADGKNEGGNGEGQEPNHNTARRPGPLKIIQYSLLAGYS
jgi:hypothetical protein